MPIYQFQCKACRHIFETQQSMTDYCIPSSCPQCQQKQIIRLFTTGNVFVKKGDDEITLGHLGNRHRDTWSDDHKEWLNEKHNAYRKSKPSGFKLRH